jgi:hypothetical protein
MNSGSAALLIGVDTGGDVYGFGGVGWGVFAAKAPWTPVMETLGGVGVGEGLACGGDLNVEGRRGRAKSRRKRAYDRGKASTLPRIFERAIERRR